MHNSIFLAIKLSKKSLIRLLLKLNSLSKAFFVVICLLSFNQLFTMITNLIDNNKLFLNIVLFIVFVEN